MALHSIFDLPVPRSMTALMQHLQRMVGVERYRYWCGGTISIEKLPAFLTKMCARYPIERNARQRTYDRSRGRAAMHMIVYADMHGLRARAVADVVQNHAQDRAHPGAPEPDNDDARNGDTPGITVWWWLVSTDGAGGLADPSSPDAHVSRDAMGADSHIVFGDYVLLYATKKEPKVITDARAGRTRKVLSDTSSWTWKIRSEVLAEVRAGVDQACKQIAYGAEPSASPGWGLRGLLAAQRSRPLFSGVRTQVVDVHVYAEQEWGQSRPKWLKAHPGYAAQYRDKAGALRTLTSIVHEHLPKMTRHRVYDDPPVLVSDLLHLAGIRVRRT